MVKKILKQTTVNLASYHMKAVCLPGIGSVMFGLS